MLSMLELAIDTLPEKRLYRFRSIDHERLERSSRIFTHSELYFASPTQLNDPWEAKPHIVIGDLGAPAYKVKYVTWVSQMMMASRPENDPEKVREWLENHTQERAEELAQEQRNGYQRSLEGYRICSFSDNVTHPLLWSHYSGSHKGFCLEFDASTDIFGHAMKVTYQTEYPSIDITEPDEDINLRLSVLTKAQFWAYEGEYRLVSMEPNEPGALPVNYHIFHFPTHLLTGVIFGCQMPQADKDLIMQWSDGSARPIQYSRMVKSATAFALEVVAA